MAYQGHYYQRGTVLRSNFQESVMPLEHMPSADLNLSFLPCPACGFLAGPTDDLILKAYARHHQTIR
jgi:hypothetical protein